MHRWTAGATALAGVLGGCRCSRPLPPRPGRPGMVVKVTPDQGLKAGQTVTVSGHGLPEVRRHQPRRPGS